MTTRAIAIVEVLRRALDSIDSLDPHEQDLIVGAIVADLRCRRPVAVSALGLWPPTEPIRDPRAKP